MIVWNRYQHTCRYLYVHMSSCEHTYTYIIHISVYKCICMHTHTFKIGWFWAFGHAGARKTDLACWHSLLSCPRGTATHCNTLQHTATHCNTLQHTATHCNAHTLDTVALLAIWPQRYCNALQRTATHCNTLQYIATLCNIGRARCLIDPSLPQSAPH